MEEYIKVMKKSVDLSSTMLEGLKHIQKLLGEGKFEETIYLFEDVVAAFTSIEQSITPIKEKLETDKIGLISNNVQEALELVVSNYEGKNYGKVQEIMQFTLVPKVKKWQVELEKGFEPFLLS